MGDLAFSPTGLTVELLKDKKSQVTVNMPMTEGVHYWEIKCPINLQGIFIGVTTKGTEPE